MGGTYAAHGVTTNVFYGTVFAGYSSSLAVQRVTQVTHRIEDTAEALAVRL